MTTERPMFPPVDSARRRFLTNAAGAAASGTVLSLATISPTRAAAALKLRARCKDFGTLTEEEEARVSELNDLVDCPCSARDLGAFAQIAQARPLDGRDMDEHVLPATAIGLDETVTLGRIDPPYRSAWHVALASRRSAKVRSAWVYSAR